MHDNSGWGHYWEAIRDQHASFAAEARDYVHRLTESIDLSGASSVLDFGCGFGHVARELAPRVQTLSLWDSSAHVRSLARLRVADIPNIQLVDLTADENVNLHQGEFDLILVHSVVQYMTLEELNTWLERWRRLLRPGGRLILSDLVQPGAGFLGDMLSVLRFAWKNGVFWHELREKGFHSVTYLFTRHQRELTVVTPETLERLAERNGLEVTLLPENLSHFSSRLAASLVRRD
jgi:cyclopropane fatty-acyl-phospholipid synthase-like methyltransferase